MTTDTKFDFLAASYKLKEHVNRIVKNRTFTVTGDASHLSIAHILTEIDDIDKPRKYDFQDVDVNERNVLRSLNRFINYIVQSSDPEEKVEQAIAGNTAIVLDAPYDCRCYDCGEKIHMTILGNTIHLSGEQECKSNRVFSVEVDFPTGEIVFDDWPARFSEATDAGLMTEDGGSVNYLVGQRAHTEGFVPYQVFHHYVGNSCPSWYYNESDSSIRIGGGSYDEDTDELTLDASLTEKGSFCTDLWWVTMLDRKFYDIMMSKLPENPDKQYYKKDLNIAHIKPGRYRFTCYSALSDDYNNPVYATAEWIGEASDFVPSYEVFNEGESIMSVADAVAFEMDARYKDVKIHPETVKFAMFDYVFNTIGNGIKSKGDFYSQYKISEGTEVPEYVGHYEVEPDFKNPYPCFKKQYSLVYNLDLTELPEDWIDNLIWFYSKCKEYFLAGASDYSYAYPKSDNERETQSFEKAIANLKKDGMTEEEHYAAVSKAYECEYNGDLHEFRLLRWEKEKVRCLDFIDDTIKILSCYKE